MAESRTAAFACTISCVSFEIIPAGLPFFGFTVERTQRVSVMSLNRWADGTVLTVVIQIFDQLGEILGGLFMQVRNGDTGGEDGIVGMFCCEVSGSF